MSRVDSCQSDDGRLWRCVTDYCANAPNFDVEELRNLLHSSNSSQVYCVVKRTLEAWRMELTNRDLRLLASDKKSKLTQIIATLYRVSLLTWSATSVNLADEIFRFVRRFDQPAQALVAPFSPTLFDNEHLVYGHWLTTPKGLVNVLTKLGEFKRGFGARIDQIWNSHGAVGDSVSVMLAELVKSKDQQNPVLLREAATKLDKDSDVLDTNIKGTLQMKKWLEEIGNLCVDQSVIMTGTVAACVNIPFFVWKDNVVDCKPRETFPASGMLVHAGNPDNWKLYHATTPDTAFKILSQGQFTGKARSLTEGHYCGPPLVWFRFCDPMLSSRLKSTIARSCFEEQNYGGVVFEFPPALIEGSQFFRYFRLGTRCFPQQRSCVVLALSGTDHTDTSVPLVYYPSSTPTPHLQDQIVECESFDLKSWQYNIDDGTWLHPELAVIGNVAINDLSQMQIRFVNHTKRSTSKQLCLPDCICRRPTPTRSLTAADHLEAFAKSFHELERRRHLQSSQFRVEDWNKLGEIWDKLDTEDTSQLSSQVSSHSWSQSNSQSLSQTPQPSPSPHRGNPYKSPPELKRPPRLQLPSISPDHSASSSQQFSPTPSPVRPTPNSVDKSLPALPRIPRESNFSSVASLLPPSQHPSPLAARTSSSQSFSGTESSPSKIARKS